MTDEAWTRQHVIFELHGAGADRLPGAVNGARPWRRLRDRGLAISTTPRPRALRVTLGIMRRRRHADPAARCWASAPAKELI